MIKIGDYVTRKSYQNDIIFKVIDIQGDNYFLSGVCVRLLADSPYSDLVVSKKSDDIDDFFVDMEEFEKLDRNEYFYLPGKILHIEAVFS